MPFSSPKCRQHALPYRAHNTRHLSFTSGGGSGYADGASTSSNSPAGVAASMQAHHQQQQQRSSSSSLQVLASLQLDATLASITQEARHDGALAERLAHWKRAFREKGKQMPHVSRGRSVSLQHGVSTGEVLFVSHVPLCWARSHTTTASRPERSFHAMKAQEPCLTVGCCDVCVQAVNCQQLLHPGRSVTSWQQCCPLASWTAATPLWMLTSLG